MTTPLDPNNSLKRDSLIMGLIGSAHFTSHFFQLSLPPLFPLLHDHFNVSYVELGSILTIFYLVSGICQAFAGILVDHYGARRILIGGIGLMATCVGLMGFVTEFWMLYPLMALAGLGNGVFHPADLSALSHQVSKRRLGRAYSIHAASGRFGFANAPLLVGTLATLVDWRLALWVAGGFGWIITLIFILYSHHVMPDHGDGHHAHNHPKVTYLKIITTPAILLGIGYFIFTTAAGSGFQAFSSVSFVEFFHVELHVAASMLSAFLVSSATGMLLGGFIADHTEKHVSVAVIGLGMSAVLMSVLAVDVLPLALVTILICIIGLSEGVVSPSRDILIKGAAPPGSTGRVFGFVYSGVDAGATLAPLFFGLLIDAHAYHMLFAVVALLYAAGIPFVIPIGRRQLAKRA
ncbi:MAG: MFS transporter [Alphaproteobacteria bacterium]